MRIAGPFRVYGAGMDDAEKIVLQAEIESGIRCELNHGPGQERPQAVMHLCQPLGYRESDICDVVKATLTIPICAECAEALQGEEWTLLLCKCGASQWVYRAWAKRKHTEHIEWRKDCPECWGVAEGMGSRVNTGAIL